VRGEQDVASHDRLLRDARPAAQPKHTRELTLVHLRVLGEARFLRVLGDDAVEGLDVFQCPPHQHGIGDAPAVVGEHPHPRRGVGHRAELGQPLPRQPHGDGADGPHVAIARLLAQPPYLLDHPGRVGHRLGVGHGVYGRETAQRRRPGAGQHRLCVLAPGLPQVRVQVDQAGQRHQSVRVQDECARSGPRAPGRPDLDDPPLGEHEVVRRTPEQRRTPDDDVGDDGVLTSQGHRGASRSGRPIAGSDPPSSR
jgi:hypothetical protein